MSHERHCNNGGRFGDHRDAGVYQEHMAVVLSRTNLSRCYDNAAMESFFHTLKTELIHRRQYHTHTEARAEIFDYIEVFYNRQRQHSALGYKSPAEFEAD